MADKKLSKKKCPRQLRSRDIRSIVVCFAACLASGIIGLTKAQGFAPVQSCTSDLSSFAGIVCSAGDAVTAKIVHCVLNERFQAGLVCSAWSHISAGRCPRYLERYSGIDDFVCIGNELCPKGPYKSYEVYKYPACLNSSLYITKPTTTPADTTEQPSTCRDCGDGGSTGSTTHTETTTKSTLPNNCSCDVFSDILANIDSVRESMPSIVPLVMCAIVQMTLYCVHIVMEYDLGKFLLGVICGRLKNGSCGHSTTGTQQVPQGQAEEPAQGHLMSGQGSGAGPDHQYQQV